MKNLVTPIEYAKLAGTSVQAIYNREKEGHVEYTVFNLPNGEVKNYIDVDKFPPTDTPKKGRPRLESKIKEENE